MEFNLYNGDEIHLWIFQYSQYKGPTYLDDSERVRAESFKYPIHKYRFIERRSCLKFLLGKYHSINPEIITLEIGSHGKPFLNDKSLAFNSSNSADYYIICIQQASTIGCDIEKNVTHTDYHEIAQLVFSKEEQAMLKNASNTKKTFYNIWSRKEAFIKADGKGISYGLASFTVEGRPENAAKVLSSSQHDSYELISVDTLSDFSLAICYERTERDPKLEIFTSENLK